MHIQTRQSQKKHSCYSNVGFQSDNAIDLHSLKKHQNNNRPLKKSTASFIKDNLVESTIGSWLPLAAEKYKISPKLEDYVCIPVVIMPSDLPNRNGIAFPYKELTAFNPNPYTKRVAYQTWEGSPTFYEHCLPGTTPIQLEGGKLKPLLEVEEGDTVQTHLGRYRKVIKKYNNGVKRVTKLRAYGSLFDLEVTENHPTLIVDRRQLFGGTNGSGWRSNQLRQKDYKQLNIKPHWREVSDVYHGDYLCIPIDFQEKVSVDAHFAFLVGAFLAEGSYRKSTYADGKQHYTGITITTGTHEDSFNNRIKECLTQLGYKYTYKPNYQQRNADQFTVNSVELANNLFSLVGEYSHSKYLSSSIKTWDKESIRHLLGAYISGDGHVSTNAEKKGAILITSTSKQLLIDIQRAFAYIGIPTGTCISNPLTQKAIRERNEHPERFKQHPNVTKPIISRHDAGTVRVPRQYSYLLKDYVVGKSVPDTSLAKVDTVKMVVTPEYLLVPIYVIEREYKECPVFNLEVEEDNTYVASNFVVHNCNDDYTKAKGVVFAASMVPIEGSEGNLYKVITLLGFDRTKDQALYNRIDAKLLSTYSMGAYVNNYHCSICGKGYDQGGCKHVSLNDPSFKIFDTEHGPKLAYYEAVEICGFEVSAVETPAYVSAQNDYLLNLD